jgi:hypothetical protein
MSESATGFKPHLWSSSIHVSSPYAYSIRSFLNVIPHLLSVPLSSGQQSRNFINQRFVRISSSFEITDQSIEPYMSWSIRLHGNMLCAGAHVRFDVLTAVTMKYTVFWVVVAPCSWEKPDVSEEHTTSIFRVDSKSSKPVPSLPPASASFLLSVGCNRWNGGSVLFRNNYTALQPSRPYSLYTGCFTTLGHNCRRWFPRSLLSKKFI